jgi:hypothetical protein
MVPLRLYECQYQCTGCRQGGKTPRTYYIESNVVLDPIPITLKCNSDLANMNPVTQEILQHSELEAELKTHTLNCIDLKKLLLKQLLT